VSMQIKWNIHARTHWIVPTFLYQSRYIQMNWHIN
jgi:hypothetical protein